jgi:hypothetical protein
MVAVQGSLNSTQFAPHLSGTLKLQIKIGDERDKLRPNGRVIVKIKLDSDGLSDPAPTSSYHPKNPILGFHGWEETVP